MKKFLLILSLLFLSQTADATVTLNSLTLKNSIMPVASEATEGQILLGGRPTQALLFGTSNTGTNGSKHYGALDQFINEYTNPLEWNSNLMPTGGVIKNFRVDLNGVSPFNALAPEAGSVWSFVINVNGSDTSLRVDIDDTETGDSDPDHTIAVSASDIVTVRIYNTPGDTSTPSAYRARWSTLFVPTITGENVLLSLTGNVAFGGNAPGSPGNNDLDVMSLQAIGNPTSDQHDDERGGINYNNMNVMPCPGTLKKLYVRFMSPGATNEGDTSDFESDPVGRSWNFDIMKNGVATSLGVVIDINHMTASDTSDTVSVVAGDYVGLRFDQVNDAGDSRMWWSTVFLPDDERNIVYLGSIDGHISSWTDLYFPLVGKISVQTVRQQRESITQHMFFKSMYVDIGPDNPPGVGNTITFYLMVNGTDSGLTVSVSDTTTTGNLVLSDGSLLEVQDGDKITTHMNCTGTCTGNYPHVSYLARLTDD